MLPPCLARRSEMNDLPPTEHDEEFIVHPKSKYWTDVFASVLVAFFSFLVLFSASKSLPPTWDEGEMGRRAENVVHWVRQAVGIETNDSDVSVFSSTEIKKAWRGTVTAEGHPQFPVLLAAFGRMNKNSNPPATDDFRFGPILFFSLAIGAVFYRTKKEFGKTTALFAVLSLLLIPRLFAHAQIAAWDSSLIAAWLLAWATFPAALKHYRGAVLFGICLGLTFASKFSGFAAILPFILWIIIRCLFEREFDEPRLFLRGLCSLAIAVIIFLLFNPPLWSDPVGGFVFFYDLNTQRFINVSVLFLGKMYDLHHSLPWYNTLFWTAITVPLGLLIFTAYGFADIIRDSQKRWTGLLIFLNLSTLLVIRAFPGTPVHDGIRLFAPAFAFLALISGIGAASLWNRYSNENSSMLQSTKPFVLSVYLICLFNMGWYAPQWLSYYNVLIGGLPGAIRAGMEPTYYWDSFDEEVVCWLEEHTKDNRQVAFSIASTRTFELYKNKRRFSFQPVVIKPETTLGELRQQGFRYYVLQRRPSAEFPRDKILIEQFHPIFTKTIRHGGFGPWRLDTVPLLEIYDLSEFELQP